MRVEEESSGQNPNSNYTEFPKGQITSQESQLGTGNYLELDVAI